MFQTFPSCVELKKKIFFPLETNKVASQNPLYKRESFADEKLVDYPKKGRGAGGGGALKQTNKLGKHIYLIYIIKFHI